MPRNLYQFSTGVVTFGGSYVEHEPVDIEFDPREGMTRQEFAEECDLNALMARYQKTGLMPQHQGPAPFYGDFADLPDYMAAQNMILAADAAFMALPATVRREFENDPAKFVAFAEDEANLPKMREWGLAEPLDVPEAPAPASPAPASQDGPTPS